MARYQGQVAVFRATVPLGVQDPRRTSSPTKTVVDQHTHKKWQELGLVPVGPVQRRAVHPPRRRSTSPARCRRRRRSTAFLADKDPKKRDKLIDRLLETPEYSYYFANKWADILRVKRRNQPDRAAGHVRLPRLDPRGDRQRQALRPVRPRDPGRHRRRDASRPPTVWYKELQQARAVRRRHRPGVPRPAHGLCPVPPSSVREVEPGRLLGPGRVLRPRRPQERADARRRRQNQQASAPGDLQQADRHRHQQAHRQAGRDQAARRRADGASARTTTRGTSWSTGWPSRRTRSSPGPWPTATGPTSSAAASSIRSTTCASPTRRRNPELLDALAKELGRQQVQPQAPGQVDRQEPDLSAQRDAQRVQQARQADLRPLLPAAHVGRGAVRRGQPGDRQPGGVRRPAAATSIAPNRAIMLPDESFPSYFLDVFGRPQRISACECERVSEANLAQALHLLNSRRDPGQAGPRRRPGRPAGQGHAARRREGRGAVPVGLRPQADARAARRRAGAHRQARRKNKKLAYENILWALINTKEFVFNQ